MKVLKTMPQFEEVLSPEEFLSLSPSEKENIESVHVISPRLGTPGFGKFLVRRKTPIYHALIKQDYDESDYSSGY